MESLEKERDAMLQKLCKVLYPCNPEMTSATSSGYPEHNHSGDADWTVIKRNSEKALFCAATQKDE